MIHTRTHARSRTKQVHSIPIQFIVCHCKHHFQQWCHFNTTTNSKCISNWISNALSVKVLRSWHHIEPKFPIRSIGIAKSQKSSSCEFGSGLLENHCKIYVEKCFHFGVFWTSENFKLHTLGNACVCVKLVTIRCLSLSNDPFSLCLNIF